MKHGTYPATVELLNEMELIYKDFEGWNMDISTITNYKELPEQAKKYVEYVEQDIGVFIQWVGLHHVLI